MAENLGEATLRLNADGKQLDATLKRAQKQTRKLGLGLIGLGATLAGPLALGIKTFASYEQAMAKVQAVSGATAKEFSDLDAVARKMGETTVFTANESAQALSFMAMAGLEAQESITALPHTLNLAAAGNLELAQAADIVTNIMSGYGLAAEEVEKAVDVLAVGFTSANTDLVQLGEAFKLAGPLGKAAGIDFEETAAALSLLGNAGFQASLAGTSFRGALTRLLNPSSEAEEIIGRLGLQVNDASGKMLPFVEIIRQLEASGLTAADAMTIFGQRAGPAMLALLGQGSEALAELTNDMRNAGGTADRIAKTQLDTFQGEMTLLKSAVEGIALQVGSFLIPHLRELVAAITPVIQQITAWASANPDLARQITVVVGAISAFALAVGSALIALSFMLPALAILSGTAGIAAVVAVAALAGAGYLLYTNWDKVGPMLDELRPKWEETWGAVRDYTKEAGDVIEAKAKSIPTSLTEMNDAIAEPLEAIKAAFGIGADKAGDIFGDGLGGVGGNIKEEVEGIDFGNVGKGILNSGLLQAVAIFLPGGLLVKGLGIAATQIYKHWEDIKERAPGVWAEIEGHLKTALDKMGVDLFELQVKTFNVWEQIKWYFDAAIIAIGLKQGDLATKTAGLAATWDTIRTKAEEVWGAISAVVLQFGEDVTAQMLAYGVTWEEVGHAFERVWAFIAEAFEVGKVIVSTVIAVISALLGDLGVDMEALKAVAILVRDGLVRIIAQVIKGFVDLVESVDEGIKQFKRDVNEFVVSINFLIRAWNAVASVLRRGKLSEIALPFAGVDNYDRGNKGVHPLHRAPVLGQGGIVTSPTLAVVGDVPEVIAPLDKIGSLGGGLTVIFQDAVYGLDDFDDKVLQALLEAKRRGVTV